MAETFVEMQLMHFSVKSNLKLQAWMLEHKAKLIHKNNKQCKIKFYTVKHLALLL